jgi:hypothetical protein
VELIGGQHDREPFQPQARDAFQPIARPHQQGFAGLSGLPAAVDPFLAPALERQPQHRLVGFLDALQLHLSLPLQVQHLQGARLADGHAGTEAAGRGAEGAAMVPEGAFNHQPPLVEVVAVEHRGEGRS